MDINDLDVPENDLPLCKIMKEGEIDNLTHISSTPRDELRDKLWSDAEIRGAYFINRVYAHKWLRAKLVLISFYNKRYAVVRWEGDSETRRIRMSDLGNFEPWVGFSKTFGDLCRWNHSKAKEYFLVIDRVAENIGEGVKQSFKIMRLCDGKVIKQRTIPRQMCKETSYNNPERALSISKKILCDLINESDTDFFIHNLLPRLINQFGKGEFETRYRNVMLDDC